MPESLGGEDFGGHAACGLPQITTREAGDVVEDGIQGIIIPPADVDALAGAIQHLYDHPEIAEQSAGALYDSTEIDEILTLRVMTMTDEEKAKAETAGGYATEMSEDYKRRQAELIASRVGEADAVITTALIPGRPAPKLITEAMIKTMRPGSVIVDMAAEAGGNTELTEAGKEVVKHGVRIIGHTNLPATMPGSATQMYAKNIQTLVKHLVKDGKVELNFDDEITRGATITHGGKVVHEATAKALGIEPATPAAPAAASVQTDAPASAGETPAPPAGGTR